MRVPSVRCDNGRGAMIMRPAVVCVIMLIYTTSTSYSRLQERADQESSGSGTTHAPTHHTTAHTAQTQHTNKTHNTAQFTTRVLSRWAPVYTVRTVVTTTVRRRAPYGTVIKQPHPLQQEVFTKQILQHPTTVLFLLLH